MFFSDIFVFSVPLAEKRSNQDQKLSRNREKKETPVPGKVVGAYRGYCLFCGPPVQATGGSVHLVLHVSAYSQTSFQRSGRGKVVPSSIPGVSHSHE